MLLNETFRELGEEQLTLYGEGSGHKIQSGGKYHGVGNVDFVLFDVKIGDWYLKDSDVDEIAGRLGLLRAPEVLRGTLSDMFESVNKGLMSTYGDFFAEGIVAKPMIQLFDRAGRRIITKIKHKDFYQKDITTL